jgi:hypothetical protein
MKGTAAISFCGMTRILAVCLVGRQFRMRLVSDAKEAFRKSKQTLVAACPNRPPPAGKKKTGEAIRA